VPISKKTGASDAGALLKRIADPQDSLRITSLFENAMHFVEMSLSV
jgi:hypothetical protein